MGAVGVRPGQPFVKTMLGAREGARRHVDPQGAEPRRAHKNEERRVALPARGQVTETLLHQVPAWEVSEPHALIVGYPPATCRQL